jgi:hypothetical protein
LVNNFSEPVPQQKPEIVEIKSVTTNPEAEYFQNVSFHQNENVSDDKDKLIPKENENTVEKTAKSPQPENLSNFHFDKYDSDPKNSIWRNPFLLLTSIFMLICSFGSFAIGVFIFFYASGGFDKIYEVILLFTICITGLITGFPIPIFNVYTRLVFSIMFLFFTVILELLVLFSFFINLIFTGIFLVNFLYSVLLIVIFLPCLVVAIFNVIVLVIELIKDDKEVVKKSQFQQL